MRQKAGVEGDQFQPELVRQGGGGPDIIPVLLPSAIGRDAARDANRVAAHTIQEERLKYLTDEKRIKAVTVLFSDLEGRLHMLDYDKKFLLGAYENLTFDGSSIRGFTAQKESDLRLGIDWSAFYWVPADVFGNGKVLVFGTVIDKDTFAGAETRVTLNGTLPNGAKAVVVKEDCAGYSTEWTYDATSGVLQAFRQENKPLNTVIQMNLTQVN